MAVIVPPIKSQGIKTKLVPWINDLVLKSGIDRESRWIEPFLVQAWWGSMLQLTASISSATPIRTSSTFTKASKAAT